MVEAQRPRAPSRLRAAAPYLLLALIVLAFYADPLVTGRAFFYRDLGMTIRPVLAEARAGAAGLPDALPLWTHAISNGRPLLANPGYALLEPLNLVFLLLPFERALDLFLVLHVAIAGCAMTLLARRLGCGGAAAFAAGAAYALGGGLVSALALYWTVVAAAWAPLVVAAGLRAADRPTPRGVAPLALAIGLEAIGGQTEFVAATVLVGVVVSAARAEGPLLRRARVTLGVWSCGLLGGLALAAPQLLPAARHARTTLRAVGFTPEGVLSNSLHPLRALWLLVPGLGGHPLRALEPGGFPGATLLDGASPYLLSVYLGIVTVVLAIAAVGLARRKPATTRLVWTLAGLAVVGVVLALGRHLPGAAALVAAIPFPIPFRFPEKALYVTFLAAPPLAALGIDALRDLRVPRLPVLAAAAVALDLAVAHTGYAPTIDVADLAAPPLARELQDRSRALGVADGQWRIHHQRQRLSGGWGPPARSIRPSEEDLYLWQVRMLFPAGAAPYGLRAAMDSEGDHLDDLRDFAVARAAYGGPPRVWALALGEASVLWVVSPQPDLEATTGGILAREIELGTAEGLPRGSGYLYRNTRFVPRARVVTDASRIAPPALAEATALARKRYEEDGPWPPATVVEAEPGARLPLAAATGEAGSVGAIVEDHRGLTLSVIATRPGVLVLSDAPGDVAAWRARIDGLPAPVWRANLAYLGVPVDPGRHEVRLDYRPPGLRAGVIVMLAALVACAAALLLRPRPSR